MRSRTSSRLRRARRSARPSSSTAAIRFASVGGKATSGETEMAVITGVDERLLVGGEWVDAESGARFDVTNPATGEVVGTMPDSSDVDVRAAIDAAAEALDGWKSLAAIERARVLRRSADLIRARKLGPAMAAGCTSVVKPASATPLTAALVLRAIEDAGAPPGVVNLVTSRSSGMVAETIFGDRRVRKISFTGSTEVGKELIRLSAGQVKRLSLELGGHAPYLIFDDADLDEAVDGLIASKFRNAGQTCVCANRTYVQSGVYDEFVAKVAEKVARMVVGPGDQPGVTIGPLIDERGVEKAEQHVRDAVERGARLVTGGERLTEGEYARGSFFAPTVLEGITPEMLICSEETFGPVAGISRFETEEEAIELANDSVYGLCAYFHTRDYARLLRVAEKLDYGIVGANAGIISAPNAPFGGVKESGFGREGGAVGIDEYLDVKYVLVAGVGT